MLCLKSGTLAPLRSKVSPHRAARCLLRCKPQALVIIGPPDGYPEEPTGVVRRCLQAFRSADPRLLSNYLRPAELGTSTQPPAIELESGESVRDGGIFASCSHRVDIGTRRLAPRHLLRRSEVRSVLRLGNKINARVFACAKGGEEAILNFALSYDEGLGGRWVVDSIARDAESDYEIPTRLHPRYSPESVITAQLRAIQANDTSYALQYLVPSRPDLPLAWPSPVEAMMAELQSTSPVDFDVTGGRGVLPNEQNQISEVTVTSSSGEKHRFLFHLAQNRECAWGLVGMSRGARTAETLRNAS